MAQGIAHRSWKAAAALLIVLAASVPLLASGISVTLDLTAQNNAFDKSTLMVPVGANVTIHFDNKDSGTAHNVAIYDSSSAKTAIFQGKNVTGANTTDYTFTAPTTPGKYYFQDDNNASSMNGTFEVVPAVTVDLTVESGAFKPTTLTVPQTGYVTVHFQNKDSGTSHNFSVYDSSSAKTAIFQGKEVSGGSTFDYTFYAPSSTGSYYFQDDNNASSLNGTLTVVPSVVVDLTAHNIAFDKSKISVPAGAYVTVNFMNKDSGITHNFAVYDSSAANTAIFQGKKIQGVAQIDYTFYAPSKAGTYFFRCDVHPTIMTGTFDVTSSGG